MSKERFVTIVYRITDAESSNDYRDACCKSMMGNGNLPGLEVTGMSVEDEISLVERLKEILDGEGIPYNCYSFN